MANTAGDRPEPRGTATRAKILEATSGLLGGGVGNVTVSAIARAAGVYPNQITHHFGSKDRLVLDAAFGLLLRDTTRLQAAGRRAVTADSFRRTLARTALAMPSTPLVVHALAAASGDANHRERGRVLLAVLFRQSERYLDRTLAANNWITANGTGRDARTFWSAVFGATLLAEAGARGGPSDLDLAGTLAVSERLLPTIVGQSIYSISSK